MSKTWRAIAGLEVYSRAYIYDEYLVSAFIRSAKATGWEHSVVAVEVRGTLVLHSWIEHLLEALPNLSDLKIDGYTLHPDPMIYASSSAWLRLATSACLNLQAETGS